MVVDDSADHRFLLRAILEDSADRAVLAGEADGIRAALESIDAVDPDVVVLDERMPEASGIEAAPMILARRPGQKLLLCSACVDDTLRSRAAAAGIAACVSKDELEAIPRIAVTLAS
jgi:DNA-binding NarL/FixJ family response regulator